MNICRKVAGEDPLTASCGKSVAEQIVAAGFENFTANNFTDIGTGPDVFIDFTRDYLSRSRRHEWQPVDERSVTIELDQFGDHITLLHPISEFHTLRQQSGTRCAQILGGAQISTGAGFALLSERRAFDQALLLRTRVIAYGEAPTVLDEANILAAYGEAPISA